MSQPMLREINLAQRLTGILNCEYVSITDYYMADYLLKNFDRLSEIHVAELTEKCFTSKSAVRRFCQRLGYENLSQLKNARIRMPSFADRPSAMAEICTFWEENGFSLPVSLLDLEASAAQIKSHTYTYLMAPYDIAPLAYDFQRQLLACGHLVYIISNIDRHLSSMRFTLPKAVCLVISPEGTFANSALPYLEGTGSYNILFTHTPLSGGVWDRVIMTHPMKNACSSSVPSKYGVQCALDYLLRELLKNP